MMASMPPNHPDVSAGTALQQTDQRMKTLVPVAASTDVMDANAPANLMVAAPARWRDDFAAEAALAKSLAQHPTLEHLDLSVCSSGRLEPQD